MVYKEDIVQELAGLGLNAGDTVIVHSALSSFGEVDGGADTVIGAIMEVLGPDGTLVVPTFNYGSGIFDPQETPSVVGIITETVRTHPDAIRSLHPTHSVAAIGPLAPLITEGHEKTEPFARGSALFKALQANAKILQLGTTHTTNSMIHVAEEIVQVPYLDRNRPVQIRTRQGKVIDKWVRRPGCSRGFDKIEDVLQEQGAIEETRIGKCRARLMSARDVVNAATDMLRFNPEALLCDIPECEVCAEARAMTAAKETERQDREVIEMAEEEERTIRRIERQYGVSEVTEWGFYGDMSSPN